MKIKTKTRNTTNKQLFLLSTTIPRNDRQWEKLYRLIYRIRTHQVTFKPSILQRHSHYLVKVLNVFYEVRNSSIMLTTDNCNAPSDFNEVVIKSPLRLFTGAYIFSGLYSSSSSLTFSIKYLSTKQLISSWYLQISSWYL